jgi:hypothetical protein
VPSCGRTTARGPHVLPDDGDGESTTDGVVLGEVGSTRTPNRSQPVATIVAAARTIMEAVRTVPARSMLPSRHLFNYGAANFCFSSV